MNLDEIIKQIYLINRAEDQNGGWIIPLHSRLDELLNALNFILIRKK
jgi:hypothetical protein